ncbi:MAG: DUF4124 domain-containing protein [Dechloromonas sp.]|nr:DUF4124 domain-containing protein [Dechloromonas sp.]
MRYRMAVILPLCCFCLAASADTYRCVKGGQVHFSDTPCAAGASRVDGNADRVSREERRQAESINYGNRGQLAELEYRAARDRNVRSGVYILNNEPAVPPSTYNRRPR